MKRRLAEARERALAALMALVVGVWVLCPSVSAGPPELTDLLERASGNVSAFLDLISQVNCTEHLTQERIGDNGKILERRESSYDYLVLLSNPDGEINLVESRVAADSTKNSNDKSPLLVSNGFSMLLLVFHPYYSDAFRFSLAGQETDREQNLTKVNFEHIPGTRSPAALAVRGREYPLDISGTAWIEPRTGVIERITTKIGSEMEDVGLRAMHSDIDYAPVSFQTAPGTYWLPAHATVEVESRHQHWRNTHAFSGYKRFSVNTKEQVSKP
jgi:hypothetical protein